ncbi:MAG TPA: hypothetical protein VI298_10350 [Geobacteraceae bacterium]
MDEEKNNQEISVIGRLFSTEAFLILMGIVSLGYGIVNGTSINIFWGAMILGGSVVLHFVRKKDWKSHWEEQERLKQLYEAKKRERKEFDDTGKN